MTGSSLAIYSTDYEPTRLYSTTDDHDDEERVREFVRYGDAPLDLLIDFGEDRVLWSFKGERSTTASRTGYFVVDYRADGPDVFGGLARELQDLHRTEDWTFRYTDELRWEAGLELWRIQPDTPGLSIEQRERLFDRLRDGTGTDSPIAFGMEDYHGVLQVLRAIEDAAIDCTVAIGTDGDREALESVDLLLSPGSDDDFSPLSTSAGAFTSPEEWVPLDEDGDDDTVDADAASGSTPPADASRSATGSSTSEASASTATAIVGRSYPAQIGRGLVVVLLALSLFSFVSAHPIHPITGLAAFGGLTGAVLAYPVVDAVFDPSSDSSGRTTPWQTDAGWAIVGAGTLAGFAFPTIFRVSGRSLGTGWLFGPVTTVSNALVSVAAFVGLLFVGSALWVALRQPGEQSGSHNVLTLAQGYVLFAVCLFLATGLATALWFRVIPSAAG